MPTPVQQAFLDQARHCDNLGSPFTARVCRLCAERLSNDIPVAASILAWPGDPSVLGDSVPLRLTGALHFLARSGKAGALATVYPPASASDAQLWDAIRDSLIEQEAVIRSYLESAPQTNEVMRSSALLPGLLEVAQRTALPLVLYEIGASAGLNLILDRYRYRFGEAAWGDDRALLLIEPQWQGAAPPTRAPLRIVSRQGVDLRPVDLAQPASRERLLSYVWPDQRDRLERVSKAISTWLTDPQAIAAGDAADWLERSSLRDAKPGTTRVLFHSAVWGYFPDATKRRIEDLMRQCSGRANAATPLAWLRFELTTKLAELRLTLWPGGEDRLLALAHPHGATVQWKGVI